MVYSEEITLVGPTSAEAHFGALVRALQVAGVPTATFWMDPAMPESLLARELLPVTDRLVVDTADLHAARSSCSTSSACRRAGPAAARRRSRLAAARRASALFAGLFDPPVGGGPLRSRDAADGPPPRGQRRQRALARRLARAAARAGGRCGSAQTLGRRACGSISSRRRRQPSRPLLVPADGPCGRSGILAIELTTGAATTTRSARTAMDQAELQHARRAAAAGQARHESDAELRSRRWARAGAIRCSRAASVRAPALVPRAADRRQPALTPRSTIRRVSVLSTFRDSGGCGSAPGSSADRVGCARGAEAGCSLTRIGPPARLRPTRAIQVSGDAVAGEESVIASAIAGARRHPEKYGSELRGSMHAGARRCFRKGSST